MEQKTQDKNNKIISTALKTSPYARDTHDRCYPHFFTYGAQNTKKFFGNTQIIDHTTSDVLGYVDSINSKRRLVFNSDASDAMACNIIHHELVHIQQDYNLYQMYPNRNSLNIITCHPETLLVTTLLQEINAYALQAEGVMIGCDDRLSLGMEITSEQKAIYNEVQSASNGLYNILPQTLLETSDHGILNAENMVKYFKKNYANLSDEKKQQRVQQARLAFAQNFINKPETTDGVIRNVIFNLERNKLPWTKYNNTTDIGLSGILDTTRDGNGNEFLPKQIFCEEVLGGKNTLAVAEKLLANSKLRNHFMAAKM